MQVGAAVLGLAVAVASPPAEVTVVRGGITPRVVCAADPRYSYALYLPAGYDPARSWPILYVFDPRGGGAMAAEIFAEAAASHGFVIASSNDTRSDDPSAPNAEAVTALWNDTHARLAVDPARRYAAGFSGTGRLAVRLGVTQKGALAGVIAAGSRLVADAGKTPWPFAFFGAAGDEDFNHPEVWHLADVLAANRTPHRVAFFDGGHQWMPKPLAAEALDWFAVRAMAGGKRPLDAAIVERYRAAVAGRANALEGAGRPGEALATWEGLAEDLAGAGGAADAVAQVARLGVSARRDLERVRKQVERDADWIHEANRRIAVLAEDPPPAVSRLLREFEVEPLRTQAASADPVLARSAARRLNAVATNAGFYLGERFRAEGRLLNAARAYELAIAIDPSRPGAHLGQARVLARTGNRKEALDALREAITRGLRLPRARVAEDPELAPLAGDPSFIEILAALPPGP